MKGRDAIMDVWIAIGDCDEIQSTVVTTRSPVPWFRFLDHVKGRCPFAVGWTDNAKLHHMVEFGLSNLANRFNVMHDVVQCRFTCQICEIGKHA